MTFINEKITKEESAKINWQRFPDYEQRLGNFTQIPIRWTIDRDRNVFFWNIESPSPEIQFYKFGLCWKDELIVMHAQLKIKEYEVEKNLMDLFWTVFGVKIPEILHTERLFIFGLITEAFETFKYRGIPAELLSPWVVSSVAVTFR